MALASLSPVAAGSEPLGALDQLRAGNARFVRGALAPVPLATGPRQTLAGGPPQVMVLSCADARVPSEYIFNTGPGELFVVRTAGAVVDKSVMASLEYGVHRLHIPLLVVMGHESCDVVQTALGAEQAGPSNLDFVVAHIRAGLQHGPADRKDLRSAVLANVEQVINDALRSDVLRAATSGGQLQVVGAYFELDSGRVVFSEPIGAMPSARN